ncbi:MAG: amidase [Chloracidobacterium sp.]|nr:amidase [Chloracidobacterium sp.]
MKMIKRRDFIRTAMLSGVALATRCDRHPQSSVSGASNSTSFELEEKTIAELQESMKSGGLTARAIAEKYLSRIAAIDKQGPRLNSVIELNPAALSIAESLDAERKTKGARGPLHGIPVLIKDNIDTAGQMSTTAGSLALEGSIARRDAFVVQRLLESGAVILGKTNLSEWANFRSTRSSSGWSGRGGLTRNPYALDRNPCGSSSGSGVAVSANLCSVAIGTETDGSIVCPATTNGIVGIKPTLGLVSRSGIIPIAHSQDTAGPMARTVTDAAILLGVITGVDPRDSVTEESKGKSYIDYTRSLDREGLRGARIGVARKYFGFSDEVDRLMNDAIEVMKRSGATIIDPVDLAQSKELEDSELEVLLYEFKHDLNKYLSELGPKAPFHSLKEIIEFNEKNRDREMPYFNQELFLKAEAKGPLTTPEYLKALEKNRRLSRTKGIDAVIAKDRLDAIIAPTGGPSWTTDLVNGDHFTGSSSTPAAVAGYPAISVPAGFIHELPVGVSFFGPAYSEPMLIKLAYSYEQATRHRRAPRFLPTLVERM